VVGHILFSPVTIEPGNPGFPIAGLGPMAVLPPYQKKGIGSELVRVGVEDCRQAGYGIVVVLGHPGFYPRFGFLPACHFGIRAEWNVPDDVFMVRELTPGVLKDCSGIARYLPEFSGV
jgi:putative acetyltransferase